VTSIEVRQISELAMTVVPIYTASLTSQADFSFLKREISLIKKNKRKIFGFWVLLQFGFYQSDGGFVPLLFQSRLPRYLQCVWKEKAQELY
jgi:hypothetical protein